MRIALGISGGIAAYKTPEIVRGLYQGGAEVRVLMTPGACQFVTPLTLQTLSGFPVLRDLWGLDAPETVRHIELARQVDALVVAPATANQLAKFASGIADDLLSTFYISVAKPVILAPAMNTRMWLHPTTQAHVKQLQAAGVHIVDPEEGWLAEREVGVGRMAAVENIVEETLLLAKRSQSWAGKKVVITAGPTREAIDPVRYITNRSSGKMGYALADSAARRGADVILISGPTDLPCPFGVRRIEVTTSKQMQEAVEEARAEAWLVLMAAAVADYLPQVAPQKIKKTGSSLSLTMEQGPDILAVLGANRKEELLVGFAAETENLEANAKAKLVRKKIDAIVANDVSNDRVGFDSDQNAVVVLSASGERWEIPTAQKTQVAESIAEVIDKLHERRLKSV